MKRFALVATLMAGIAGLLGVAPAAAQVSGGIYIHVGPPAPRYEVRPARPGPGYYWQPGHWWWIGGRWVWRGGVWIGGYPGCRWIPGHWRHSWQGWYWVEGHRVCR
jgi:hypothetical protein